MFKKIVFKWFFDLQLLRNTLKMALNTFLHLRKVPASESFKSARHKVKSSEESESQLKKNLQDCRAFS